MSSATLAVLGTLGIILGLLGFAVALVPGAKLKNGFTPEHIKLLRAELRDTVLFSASASAFIFVGCSALFLAFGI